MSDEDKDLVDPDLFDDEGDDDSDTQEDKPEVDPKLQDAIAKKQHFRTKAQKLAAENKSLKEQIEQAGTNSSTALNIVTDMQIKQQHGLDDLDLIAAKGFAAGTGKTVAEMLGDKESQGYKLFDTYQKGKSAHRSETDAIPEPTTRVPIVGDKSFGELEKPEQQKNYGKSVETLIDKARKPNQRNLT